MLVNLTPIKLFSPLPDLSQIFKLIESALDFLLMHFGRDTSLEASSSALEDVKLDELVSGERIDDELVDDDDDADEDEEVVGETDGAITD